MIPNLPRSQSASATGFMPSYFKLGNNSQRGMPVMVNINSFTLFSLFTDIKFLYPFILATWCKT